MSDKIESLKRAIDQKPHRHYIVYLMTKGFSPYKISDLLRGIGLSSPSIYVLEQYFLHIMAEHIRAFEVTPVYQAYLGVLNRPVSEKKKRTYPREISYRMDILGKKSIEINFLKMIVALGVEHLWSRDVIAAHDGKRANTPRDPATGEFLIPSVTSKSDVPTSILMSPSRHIIDELIVDGVTDTDISEHISKTTGMIVSSPLIASYRRHFFNITSMDLKYQIATIIAERENVLENIRYIDSELQSASGDIALETELLRTKRSLAIRAADLQRSISLLQGRFSSNKSESAIAKQMDYVDMFEDVTKSMYSKFKLLSEANDRAVIDPLSKIVKTMSQGFEMVMAAKELAATEGNVAQAQMIQMIHARTEEVAQKPLRQEFDEVELSDILGVDELDPSFARDKGDEDSENNSEAGEAS